jgi:hypothetical protein
MAVQLLEPLASHGFGWHGFLSHFGPKDPAGHAQFESG